MISKVKCNTQFLKSNVSEKNVGRFIFKSLIFSLVSAEDFGKPFIVSATAYIKSMIPDAEDPENYGRLGKSGNRA